MGFTTGLLGGATLTYSVLYLTLYVHQANRKYQHTLLSQQSILLNSAIEPLPPLPEPPAYDVQKAGLIETLKDRWNGELEGIVRRAQTTDWDRVRQRWEARIGTVWAKLRESEASEKIADNIAGASQEAQRVAQETGERLKENAIVTNREGQRMAAEAGEKLADKVAVAGREVKRVAQDTGEQLKDSATRASQEASRMAAGAGDKFKEKLVGTGEDVKQVTHEATRPKRLLEIN